MNSMCTTGLPLQNVFELNLYICGYCVSFMRDVKMLTLYLYRLYQVIDSIWLYEVEVPEPKKKTYFFANLLPCIYAWGSHQSCLRCLHYVDMKLKLDDGCVDCLMSLCKIIYVICCYYNEALTEPTQAMDMADMLRTPNVPTKEISWTLDLMKFNRVKPLNLSLCLSIYIECWG